MLRDKRENGFTLVELLVVMAIIAVLVAIAIPIFGQSRKSAEDASCLANRTSFGRECTYAVMSDQRNDTAAGRDAIVADIMANYTDLCPSGGKYSAWCYKKAQPIGKTTNTDNSVWAVVVTCTEHSTAWTLGTSFKVGDIMTTNNYVFECLRAHTTGTTSRTRDPSLRSNKSTWWVVGVVDPDLDENAPRSNMKDGYMKYSSTVRYAPGLQVYYNGNIYERTFFNAVGGQVPYEDRSSDYWTLIGPSQSASSTP